jgi:hypothetical protein
MIHKAAPHPRVKGEPQVCETCLQPVRIVPGGQGPTWVHDATGAVAGNSDNLIDEAEYPDLGDGEQDFTDPDFVLGAVLAQVEELTPANKLRVIMQALDTVTTEVETA